MNIKELSYALDCIREHFLEELKEKSNVDDSNVESLQLLVANIKISKSMKKGVKNVDNSSRGWDLY